MQININTDKSIGRRLGLDEHVETVVQAAVGRFGEQITRVEVHLSDENGAKGGGSRCVLEARVTGYQPIAVHDNSDNLHQAISGAADKLKRAIDSALGRLHDKNLHERPVLEVEPEADKDLTSES
jgi:ribosome-associated translation inhibitor RaiA